MSEFRAAFDNFVVYSHRPLYERQPREPPGSDISHLVSILPQLHNPSFMSPDIQTTKAFEGDEVYVMQCRVLLLS